MKLVLATANADKARELADVLAGVPGLTLLPRPSEVPDVDETGTTLVANARLKARALCEATGLPALADDTGLEVAALDGAPGVHSARFAGSGATYADNVAKLQAEMEGVPVGQRGARFVTVALVRWPDGRELIAEGAVPGTIVEQARGQAGFGYDPLFAPEGGDGRTFAEMSRDEKQVLSHRGRALRALEAALIDEVSG